MKKRWVVAAKRADFKRIGSRFGIDQVIARVLRNRGLTEYEQIEQYLHGGREDLHDPHLMCDAERAARILCAKIEQGKRIRVIGDYDIDGIMATFILLSALRRAGAEADYAIPDRIADGYGLNESLVRRAYVDGADTILTCDNGISASEQIRMAKKLGMTVIVTDHHDVPFDEDTGAEILPEADAVVNPKRRDCDYPFKELCGAAVAYKLSELLYEKQGIPEVESDRFLEYAGFATVGDVMDLVGENRIIVKLGLDMLSRTENTGMRALIMQNGLTPGSIRAYHIGFRIGPCLNASGRLDTAVRSLALLECRDHAEAAVLAGELTELNESRKRMTEAAVRQAKEQTEREGYLDDPVLVIFLPECHESIAGIVAGRLREAYYRPTLVITRGEKQAKGSGRSIEGYSMYEELSKCRELFSAYGGHPMAAGFSLPEENIAELRRRLNELSKLDEAVLTPKVVIDAVMPLSYIGKELVRQLECLEPFGKGNEKPIFAERNLRICSLRIFGKERQVIRMGLESTDGARMDGIYFGDIGDLEAVLTEKYGDEAARNALAGRCGQGLCVHVLYYPEIDHYGGRDRLQIRISGFST